MNFNVFEMLGLLQPEELSLCRKLFGSDPVSVCGLPKSGSDRNYFRIFFADGKSVILCRSKNIEENKVFIDLCNSLFSKGMNVPEILAVSFGYESYIQTDLGNVSLFDVVTEKESAPSGSLCLRPESRKFVLKTLESLVALQSQPSKVWEPYIGFPPLGPELIQYDFQYFLNQFVLPSAVDFDRIGVVRNLALLGERLASYPREVSGFMYRDFQSRNVMLHKTAGSDDLKPYFIDFQSARRGPCVYDLVSFVWQAKAAYTDDERRDFVDHYVKCYSETNGVGEDLLRSLIPLWAIFRVMQVLGAYGLRGLKEGKQHFIDSIPYAVANLFDLLSLPEMKEFTSLFNLAEILMIKTNR